MPNLSRALLCRGYTRKARQQLARVHEYFGRRPRLRMLLQTFEGQRFLCPELSQRGSPQRRQVCTDTERLPEFVRDRPHVRSRRDSRAKPRPVTIEPDNLELLHLYLNRLQFNLFILARQLVCGNALDLFRRKWRRSLLDNSFEALR